MRERTATSWWSSALTGTHREGPWTRFVARMWCRVLLYQLLVFMPCFLFFSSPRFPVFIYRFTALSPATLSLTTRLNKTLLGFHRCTPSPPLNPHCDFFGSLCPLVSLVSSTSGVNVAHLPLIDS